MHPTAVDLDPTLHGPQISEIKRKLLARTIGQDSAVDKFVGILETFFAGYCNPNKPVGVVLELGPTGTGKTSLVENLVPPSCRQQKPRAQARSHSQAAPPPLCRARFEPRQLKRDHSPLQVFACIPTSCWFFPLI
jgi:predicted Ser/Thr protein kinase